MPVSRGSYDKSKERNPLIFILFIVFFFFIIFWIVKKIKKKKKEKRALKILSYYRILEVDINATDSEIKTSYNKLLEKYKDDEFMINKISFAYDSITLQRNLDYHNEQENLALQKYAK